MVSSIMSTLEGECICFREIYINVNNLLAVLLLIVVGLSTIILYCILILVVACLLLYPFLVSFYIDVVAIFLFIR